MAMIWDKFEGPKGADVYSESSRYCWRDERDRSEERGSGHDCAKRKKLKQDLGYLPFLGCPSTASVGLERRMEREIERTLSVIWLLSRASRRDSASRGNRDVEGRRKGWSKDRLRPPTLNEAFDVSLRGKSRAMARRPWLRVSQQTCKQRCLIRVALSDDQQLPLDWASTSARLRYLPDSDCETVKYELPARHCPVSFDHRPYELLFPDQP